MNQLNADGYSYVCQLTYYFGQQMSRTYKDTCRIYI